jgi:hypothetical protein
VRRPRRRRRCGSDHVGIVVVWRELGLGVRLLGFIGHAHGVGGRPGVLERVGDGERDVLNASRRRCKDDNGRALRNQKRPTSFSKA